MSKAKAPPKYNTIVCNIKGQWTKLVLTDAELSRAEKRTESTELTNAQKTRIINGMNSRPLELNGIRYYVVNGATAGRN
jgi:hypothetical protein